MQSRVRLRASQRRHSSMEDPASLEIKERERINLHLARFSSLLEWTPVMGALLVSGAGPIAGMTELPNTAADLRNPGVAASQRALSDASRVLARWQESWEDAVECGRAQCVPSAKSPFEFLQWCQEEYENDSELNKPGWLLYWLVFTGMAPEAHAPLPVPTPIVARAADLEGAAAVLNAAFNTRQSDPAPPQALTPAPSRTKSQLLIDKMIELMEQEGRSPINGSIIRAIREANSDRPAAVWHQLCLLAANGRHGLKFKDEETLWIPTGEGGGENLSKKSFTQHLRRYRVKADAKLSSSE